ncbi:outer membrane beta-barrel protein [Pleionea sediminis]|uniref:outer membrane beta-barrel protein n=1 Tax=Pleionea sediminis TaxID=2569479 RepID=UPI0011856C65|nr:outer membrane beta-barrel protein [Pleionea sediminis]
MNKKVIGLALASLLSAGAYADNYAGVSYKMVEIDGGGGSVEPSAVEGKFGKLFTKNFAVEGRLGVGIADDDSIDVDSMIGVFAAYHFMPKEKFNPYVILGYARTEVSFPGGSNSETDVSYGFGGDIAMNPGSALNFEYVNYLDKDGVEATAISVGWTWKF